MTVRSLWMILLLMSVSVGLTQGARSLGMGGVTLPDRSSAAQNPAYAAAGLSGPSVTLPLPLGVLRFVTSEALSISTSFDLLAAIDQISHLETYIFNLPQSPEEISLTINQESGEPLVAIATTGGDLAFDRSILGYSTDFNLPINFGIGPVRLGIRPYLLANGNVVSDEALSELFQGGTTSGSLRAKAALEAGIALDVFYAAQLSNRHLGITEEGVRVFFGTRAAPYVGLARADGSGTLDIAAVLTGNSPDVEYSVDGTAFVSSVATGNIGYGGVWDVGIATEMPTDSGVFSFGLGLTNFGIALWNGLEYTLSGDQANDPNLDDPVAASRTYFSPNFNFLGNAAYNFELTPTLGLLLAADLGFTSVSVSSHLGTELLFNASGIGLAARAGLGYDGGFSLGLGGGLRAGAFYLDFALTSHRAPFTDHQSYGVTASLGF